MSQPSASSIPNDVQAAIAAAASKTPETHNEVVFDRNFLLTILADFSSRLLNTFRTQITLVIHGGAVMILHPTLASSTTRRSTRDVDFIKRSFVSEMKNAGVPDAEARLQACIDSTAAYFRLGTDWMNAHADVALPMALTTQNVQYDPLYIDAMKPNNVALNTVYQSPGLKLISVTMFWGVALKMVRYQKDDPADILAMLRHGTKLNGVQWTPDILERWLLSHCWPMGYSQYPTWKKEEMRERFQHAIGLVQTAQTTSQGAEAWRPPQHLELTRHGSVSSISSLSSTITMPMPEPSTSVGNWRMPQHAHHISAPQPSNQTPVPASAPVQQPQAQWRPPLVAHHHDPRYNGVTQQHWRSNSSPMVPMMGTPTNNLNMIGNPTPVIPPNHMLHNSHSNSHMKHRSNQSDGNDIVIPPPPILFPQQSMFGAPPGFQPAMRRPMV
ncbi:hypothetical protein HWV62_12564 [Athelia sp. TMB]|nr:hypothetical protein HWV62_12564 [Athelia sp. TMB]